MRWWKRLMGGTRNEDAAADEWSLDYEWYARAAEGLEDGNDIATTSLQGAFLRLAHGLGDPRLRAGTAAKLRREPRWLDLAARLRRGPCERGACELLDKMSREVIDDLIARHPVSR